MTTPKEYVQQRFPKAVYHYRDHWQDISRRFKRVYSIYTDNDLDAECSLLKKIGEANTVEAAWVNAMFNIETH